MASSQPISRGHAGGHRLAVAGNHRDAAHAAVLQFGQRLAGFGAGLVLQPDPADALAVARDEDQAPAFGFVQVHRLQEILLHAVVLQPLRAADQHLGAVHLGLDAAAGGFGEVLRLGQRHAGFGGQLRQRLGGGVVAVFLGGGGEAQQFGGLDVAERRQAADGQFAGGERAGLVEDEGVDLRGQLRCRRRS